MNSKTAIQTVTEAEAIENKLSIRIDALERRIDEATSLVASDVTGLAEGKAINTEEITRLHAELQVLMGAHESAQRAVVRAQHLSGVRATLERKERLAGLMQQGNSLAGEISSRLDDVAEFLAQLELKGREIVATLGHHKDKLGPYGYVAIDPTTLLRAPGLAVMLDGHLATLVPRWRVTRGDAHPRTFKASVAAELGTIQNELETLGGFQVSPDDEQLVRADMLRSGPEATLPAPPDRTESEVSDDA